MSSRKSKQGLIWSDCSKCGVKLLRTNATKHAETGCGALFPLIENGVLIISLVKPAQTSPINKLPFLKTAVGQTMLFLPEFVMKESALESFTWVLVSCVGTVDKKEKPDPPVAMQIWPSVEENVSVTAASAIVTEEAVHLNLQLVMNTPHSIVPLKTSLHPLAETIDILIDCPRKIDSKRFRETFRRQFRGRLLTIGNKFKLRFYSEIVGITIVGINDDARESEDLLCESMDKLKFGDVGDLSFLQEKYYKIDYDTEIKFATQDEAIKSDRISQVPRIESVGGLVGVINELRNFIIYAFSGSSKVVPSVLLHGPSGTGKSLLVSALCNSMEISGIVCREYCTTDLQRKKSFSTEIMVSTIEDAVGQALSHQPAAIVVEDIESVISGASSSSKFSNAVAFAHKLKSALSTISDSKVVLLVTTSKIEMLDTTVRSPQLFSKEIEVSVPTMNERTDISRKLLDQMNHQLTGEDIISVAAATHGFVGADLLSLFSESMFCRNKGTMNESDKRPFNIDDVRLALKTVRPSAMKSILIDVPNVSWNDIGGQHELKLKLKQMIEWPLKYPEKFQRLGIAPPKGILMFGPPGCSKTMVAKAIASESGLNFIAVKASELFSKWVGESEKAVQKIFAKARQVSPCIVFFDEIDSLGGERGSTSGSSNVHERVLAQMLVEMDGIQPLKEVTIIAATNRPDIIDQALLRPGRLDRIMYVPLPDLSTRQEIFSIQSRKMSFSEDVDIEHLAKSTEFYSGAEITAVCQEAGLHALEENINATVIRKYHFELALQSVRPRITKEQITFYEDYNEKRKARY